VLRLTPILKEHTVKSKGTSKARGRKKASTKFIERLNLNAAGIDIGSETHWVAVPEDRSDTPVRSFRSFTNDLYLLADWLSGCGIDTVSMESTGVYWIPLYEVLEERGFKVLLVNARHVKNVPGRKSDVIDCQWLQQLHTYGLLRGSFRPDEEIVQLRAYLRHRENLVRYAASHIQHMQKALTLMNVQLHKVIADITGLTGMRIIRDIVSGNHDPQILAQQRHHRCKASDQEIAEALTGNYRSEHLFALGQALQSYDHYQGMIQTCDQAIETLLDTLAAGSSVREAPLPKKKRQSNSVSVI
jgi:transposase